MPIGAPFLYDNIFTGQIIKRLIKSFNHVLNQLFHFTYQLNYVAISELGTAKDNILNDSFWTISNS